MTNINRILILGASGMLGNAMLRYLSRNPQNMVYGSVRNDDQANMLRNKCPEAHILSGFEIEHVDSLVRLFDDIKPTIVINCVGIIKQLIDSNNVMRAITVNALLPHRLALLSKFIDARLIHFSTDCVFSGSRGDYSEIDNPDATDLYGRSKLLGEVDYGNSITIRTSIIGHELYTNRSLIDWFLSQNGEVYGYTNAIFSGLPTLEIARITDDLIIPRSDLKGLYHLSAEPISKFNLLSLVSSIYKKEISIVPKDDITINRSLNSNLFRSVTGFQPQPWPTLIERMYEFQ